MEDCPTGKAGYANSTKAARAKRALERRRNARPHANLSPFHCRFCGEWHLGRPRTINPFKAMRTTNRKRYSPPK